MYVIPVWANFFSSCLLILSSQVINAGNSVLGLAVAAVGCAVVFYNTYFITLAKGGDE